MVARSEVSVEDVVAQREKIQEVMKAVMREGVHYGRVPGVSKPTLLKPGAEVLAVTFRLASSYRSERTFHDGDHLTVVSRATLTHIPTALVIAEGEGLCTTREKKYRWRQGERTCPDCGATAIVRSTKKKAYYCIGDKGGCGHRFAFGADKAKELDGQETMPVENPDLADTWNTVLKMANKRALVAAILNGTAASDIFTQDVEDLGPTAVDEPAEPERPVGPKDWKEISAWVKAYGVDIGWSDWTRQASETLFENWDGVSRPTDEQLAILGERASVALLALREIHDPSAFPPPTRSEIQQAWASALDGAVIEGPEWRMSPNEEDRPERGDETPDEQTPAATEAGETISAPSEEDTKADDENIPFGEG